MYRRLAIAATVFILSYSGFAYWKSRPTDVSIEAHGRIVDRDTGEPVTGAWVILALWEGGPAFHGSSGGCAVGSAVVRTDDTGRFRHQTTMPRIEKGDSREFNIYVYHPAYTTDIRLPLMPNFAQVPSGTPHQSVAAALLPYYQPPGESEGLFATTRRGISEWEDLQNLSEIWTRACLDSNDDRGQSGLLRTLYQRAWEIHCVESSSTTNANFPMNSLFNYFEIALEKIAAHMGLGYDGRSKDYASARRFYVVNSIFPDIPEFGSMKYQPPVTADQVKRFCDFYSQPIPDLIKKEFVVEKEFIVP